MNLQLDLNVIFFNLLFNLNKFCLKSIRSNLISHKINTVKTNKKAFYQPDLKKTDLSLQFEKFIKEHEKYLF